MLRRFSRRRQKETAELDITAFMNLMVVLVPFLLITAVFSRVAVLQLALGSQDAQPAQAQPPALQLEVIVRADALEVADRTTGPLARFPSSSSGYDYAGLSQYLQQVKARFPDEREASVLLEPEVAYDTLVQVMDTVRLAPVQRDGTLEQAELFPDIAVGDAPPAG